MKVVRTYLLTRKKVILHVRIKLNGYAELKVFSRGDPVRFDVRRIHTRNKLMKMQAKKRIIFFNWSISGRAGCVHKQTDIGGQEKGSNSVFHDLYCASKNNE